MGKRRKTYDREFKLEALRLAESSEKSIAEIERELGLSVGQLHHWRRELAEAGEQAFPGKGNLSPDEAQLRQLQRENEILRQERDILKKAIAIFSRASK
jgi:transposase